MNKKTQQAENQRSRVLIKIIPCAVLLLATAALVIYLTLFTTVGGKVVSRSAESLDLRGCEEISLDELTSLDSLRSLDIRGAAMTAELFESLQQSLPECSILWSVPLGSQSFDCTAEEIALPADTTAEDLKNLSYFDSLGRVDASACTAYEALYALAGSEPGFDLDWGVTLGGEFFPADTAEVTLNADVAPEEWINLTYLDNLTAVDTSAAPVCPETAAAYALLDGCEMDWSADVCGRSISSDETFLDLRGLSFSGIDEWKEQLSGLACLPNMQKVDMCGCGLTSLEMEQLCELYPHIKFVWEIYITAKVGNEMREWYVRTDALAFSTLIAEYSEMNQSHFQELFKYCTDLIALDIGHNKITDISGIENLTKLKYLILHDNKITDLSPLAACKDLMYIELNWNNVADLTPLCELKDLTYIYMMGNEFDLEELKEFAQLPSLKHVAITNFDIESRRELQAIRPECNWNASYEEWYGTPVFKGIKEIFDSWQYVTYLESYDNVKYDWSLVVK